MRSLHERTTFTAKSITMKLVESSQPICNILSKHESVSKDNIMLLLTRL